MGNTPLLFSSDLKGAGTFAGGRRAESSAAATEVGRNCRRELRELIQDKQNREQKCFTMGMVPPGAPWSLSDPAQKWSALAGAGAVTDWAEPASLCGHSARGTVTRRSRWCCCWENHPMNPPQKQAVCRNPTGGAGSSL